MDKKNYFTTPIWAEERPDFIKSLNKASDKYIKDSKKKHRKLFKTTNDYGQLHYSGSLANDNNFLDFRNYIGAKSWEFLDDHGYDMDQYQTILSHMWVQEFSQNGGGHQSTQVSPNQHVSGFYFLKCSDKTSFPIFHEPRTGAKATKLKMKTKLNGPVSGTGLLHFKPIPGTLIIFPSYLEYEFAIDAAIEPFRFIQWNIQSVPKEIAKDA